jgi:hypothetical protein
MSELIITTKDDLEKMLKSVFGQIEKSKHGDLNPEKEDRLNQKQAAEYLGITQRLHQSDLLQVAA